MPRIASPTSLFQRARGAEVLGAASEFVHRQDTPRKRHALRRGIPLSLTGERPQTVSSAARFGSGSQTPLTHPGVADRERPNPCRTWNTLRSRQSAPTAGATFGPTMLLRATGKTVTPDVTSRPSGRVPRGPGPARYVTRVSILRRPSAPTWRGVIRGLKPGTTSRDRERWRSHPPGKHVRRWRLFRRSRPGSGR